jgi:protein CpxP
MKTWILAMTMMVGMTLSAQVKREHPEPLKPEQKVELQVKKMTLALDLNDKQQKDIQQLLLEKSKQREILRQQHLAHRQAGQKLTADERFALRNTILDEKIEMKAAMKKILTPEQFAKLEQMKKASHQKITKRGGNFKKHERR